MIGGLSHTNIRVHDIDRCLPFYRDVLGLSIAFDQGGQQVAPGSWRRAVFLRWDDSPSFVVLQSLPPDAASAREQDDFKTKLYAMGLNHFGFWVDDLEPILARAEAAGVQFARGTVNCNGRAYGFDDASDETYVRTAQLVDPENNVVQLDQWMRA